MKAYSEFRYWFSDCFLGWWKWVTVAWAFVAACDLVIVAMRVSVFVAVALLLSFVATFFFGRSFQEWQRRHAAPTAEAKR